MVTVFFRKIQQLIRHNIIIIIRHNVKVLIMIHFHAWIKYFYVFRPII